MAEVTGVALINKPLSGRRIQAKAKRKTPKCVECDRQRMAYAYTGQAFNMRCLRTMGVF